MIFFTPTMQTVLAAFFLLLAYVDIKQRKAPNVLLYPAIIAIVLLHLVETGLPATAVLLGGAMGGAIFGVTAWLRPGDLGGGDVKLAAFIGLTFGFPHVLWALLVGAMAGAVTAVFLLSTGRGGRKTHIPYVPFLAFGAIVALFYVPALF